MVYHIIPHRRCVHQAIAVLCRVILVFAPWRMGLALSGCLLADSVSPSTSTQRFATWHSILITALLFAVPVSGDRKAAKPMRGQRVQQPGQSYFKCSKERYRVCMRPPHTQHHEPQPLPCTLKLHRQGKNKKHPDAAKYPEAAGLW